MNLYFIGYKYRTLSSFDNPVSTNQGVRVKKGYVDGPFGQIHYYEQGSGPCLILGHQSPVCGRTFERAMPLLADAGIRAIAIDTPGYGNSDVPSAPPTIAEYADAFIDVLNKLDLSQAHFLGHHTGAAIFCNLAARFPERVTSLVLNGPPLLSAKDLEQFKDFKLGPDPIHKDGSHLQTAWEKRLQYSPGWTDEVAMHRRLVDQLWAGDTWWYGHAAAFSYDMTEDFMALVSETMILTNTGDDIYHLAQKARRDRPEFEYVKLAGGTHDIVDEQPQAWTDVVADFVLKSNEKL